MHEVEFIGKRAKIRPFSRTQGRHGHGESRYSRAAQCLFPERSITKNRFDSDLILPFLISGGAGFIKG
jgi:hypothetical protein